MDSRHVLRSGVGEFTVLSKMAVGEQARVESVDGCDDVTMRLLEMGLTPGVQLALIGVAPLGDPIEVEIRGYRLSLRKSEAARITVEIRE